MKQQRMGLAQLRVPVNQENRWMTTEELHAFLGTYGLQVSESQLDEFVRRGVLAHPTRDGRGRAGGVSARWSGAQCAMLLTALELQRDGAKVVDLCPLPVAAWAYWGDASGVPLVQVRWAMQTWAAYQWRRTQRSYEKMEQDARRLCQGIRHRGAVETQKAIGWLAGKMYRWEAMQELDLVEALRPVIDPDGRGVARGPRDAPLSPERVSAMLVARLRALDALRQDQVPDGLWEWSRAFYLTGLVEYAQRRAAWAQEVAGDRYLSPSYAELTLESLYQIVCKELLQCVGLGLADLPFFPPLWQPQHWIQGLVSARVRTEMDLLPGVDGGPPIKHFQTNVRFVLSEGGAERLAGADCRDVSFGYRGTAPGV